ncbi:hypothetical protein NWP09_09020, partial [Agrococcus sp. HG114]|nr:hypothetical protein [Agrococcus sp. HG114]
MTWLLGSLLGLGLVLAVSPWLWPKRGRHVDPRAAGRLRDRFALAGLDGVPSLALAAVCVLGGVLAAGVALA